MQSLLAYLGENKKFDRTKVESILENFDETSEIRKENLVNSIIEVDFSLSDDSTIIRLSEDLETVSFSGTTDASLKAVIEFNKSYNDNIRLVDLDYSFDIELASITTIDDLKRLMNEE